MPDRYKKYVLLRDFNSCHSTCSFLESKQTRNIVNITYIPRPIRLFRGYLKTKLPVRPWLHNSDTTILITIKTTTKTNVNPSDLSTSTKSTLT